MDSCRDGTQVAYPVAETGKTLLMALATMEAWVMSVHKRHNWVMDVGLPAAFALVWGCFAVLFRLFG
ncbi:MAG: hypothetical protein HOB49_21410 [Gemmatimonadetes bacterium]|jgi:hypothetical protein|nr:hypothetical protein [Gemmatimonadota bacterium]